MNAKRRTQRPKARITSAGWKAPRASVVSGSVASVLPGNGAMRLPAIHVHFGRVNTDLRRAFVRLCKRENVYAERIALPTWRNCGTDERPDIRQDSAEVWEAIGHSGNLTAIAQWIDGVAYVRMTLPVAGGAPFIAAGSGGTESAGASKAIRRVTMPKREREARYTRESPEYRQSVRDSDKLRDKTAKLAQDETARAENRFLETLTESERVDSYHERENAAFIAYVIAHGVEPVRPAFVPMNGETAPYDCLALPALGSIPISPTAHSYGFIDALRYWKLLEQCERDRQRIADHLRNAE